MPRCHRSALSSRLRNADNDNQCQHHCDDIDRKPNEIRASGRNETAHISGEGIRGIENKPLNDIKSYELVLRDAVNVNRFYGSAHTRNGKTLESKRAD